MPATAKSQQQTSDSPPQSTTEYIYAIDQAVENLRDYASDARLTFENGGDLTTLADSLAYIRDRAGQIQNAVLGTLEALRTNL